MKHFFEPLKPLYIIETQIPRIHQPCIVLVLSFVKSQTLYTLRPQVKGAERAGEHLGRGEGEGSSLEF